MKQSTPGGGGPSIAHLAPLVIRCACPDIGRDLVIRVAFSNHCYSEKFDPERHDPEQIIVRDAGGRRVFCPVRHGLSYRLPEIVKRLPQEQVYQTAQRRNYVFAVPLAIEGQVYEVFFVLQRAEKVPGIDLRLTVESAYPVDAPTPRPRRPNAIRFKVLAYKVLRGQPVRFAAR